MREGIGGVVYLWAIRAGLWLVDRGVGIVVSLLMEEYHELCLN